MLEYTCMCLSKVYNLQYLQFKIYNLYNLHYIASWIDRKKRSLGYV